MNSVPATVKKACFQSEVDEVKDKEYIILYLEEEMEKYRRVHESSQSDDGTRDIVK